MLDSKNPNRESTKCPILFLINKINPVPFTNRLTGKMAVL